MLVARSQIPLRVIKASLARIRYDISKSRSSSSAILQICLIDCLPEES